MELSVIIVSYNVCTLLRQALLSLMAAATGIVHEIIIVDNNSSDNSATMVSEEFPSVKLIISEINEGYSAACNKGIEVSSGEYILILNPDTVVDPDALANALRFMRIHPEAGAAGAHMTDGSGRFLQESRRGFPSPVASLFRFTGLGKLFPRSPFFNAYYLGNPPENETCPADILPGAFMLLRREVLDKTGLFDTDYFMYGEDIDLSWRIRKAGYINYFLHNVRITHYKGASSSQFREASTGHFYDAMNIFAGKHLKRGWHLPVRIGVGLIRALSLARFRLKRVIKIGFCC